MISSGFLRTFGKTRNMGTSGGFFLLRSFRKGEKCSPVSQGWILITGLYLCQSTIYALWRHFRSCAVSAAEVMNCLIFCLLSQRVHSRKKILIGLSTLLHFLTDIDCSPLPTLKYTQTFTSFALLMIFMLPCNRTFLQFLRLWLSDQDHTEVANGHIGLGQDREETKLGARFYNTTTVTGLHWCFALGAVYKTDAYSLILWENNLFNSITPMEIKNLLRLPDHSHLHHCTGGWPGDPQSLPQTFSLCTDLNLLQTDCRGGLVTSISRTNVALEVR